MKISKDMVHEDLQSKYAQASLLPRFLKRRWFLKLMGFLLNRTVKGEPIAGLQCEQVYVPSRDDDYSIRVRVYKPTDHNKDNKDNKQPLLLYIHGGGYLFGMPEISHSSIEQFISTRACVVLAPDYRKAFTKPYPAGLNDCYDTVLWAIDHADELGIDATKIIVAGHSAGGGLTAALTLKARDSQDFKVAFQMPLYPMIDDQQPNDPQRAIDSPVWNTEMNTLGWGAYLADLIKNGDEIPSYAAPIRNQIYENFPPTITFVGTLEPFYRETLSYVNALKKAGIEVAFKEYPNCFHGFDAMAGDTPIGKDGLDFTFSNYADFYDRYL